MLTLSNSDVFFTVNEMAIRYSLCDTFIKQGLTVEKSWLVDAKYLTLVENHLWTITQKLYQWFCNFRPEDFEIF